MIKANVVLWRRFLIKRPVAPPNCNCAQCTRLAALLALARSWNTDNICLCLLNNMNNMNNAQLYWKCSLNSIYSVTSTIPRVQPSVYKACCHYNHSPNAKHLTELSYILLLHILHTTFVSYSKQPVVCGSIAKRVSAVRPRDCLRQLQELCLESVTSRPRHTEVPSLIHTKNREIKFIQKRIVAMTRPATV